MSNPSENGAPTSCPERRTRVQVMGGFGVFCDGHPIDLPDSARRLIACLALCEGPRERALVAATLWPEKTDARAAANLRSSLWKLQMPNGTDLVSSHRSCLELEPSIDVDARLLQRDGWQLVHGELPAASVIALDRSAFATELLPGWYDEWVIAERERLTQLQLHFMEALAYALVAAGQVAEALDIAVRLVGADPLREGSQRALLWIFCSEGSLGQARRQLDRYRSDLHREFGLEPELTLDGILADILADIGPHTAAESAYAAAGQSA